MTIVRELGKHKVIRFLEDFNPIDGIILLEDYVTYLVEGIIDVEENIIITGTQNSVIGTDKSNDKLISSTSSIFIQSNSAHSLQVFNCTLLCDNGTLFDINNTAILIDRCSLRGKVLGYVTDSVSITIRDVAAVGTTENGFYFFGNNGSCRLAANLIKNNTGAFFNLADAIFDSILICTNLVITNEGQQFLSGLSEGENITHVALVNDNIFLGDGTIISGITASSNKWSFSNNSGITTPLTNAIFSQTVDTVIADTDVPTEMLTGVNPLPANFWSIRKSINIEIQGYVDNIVENNTITFLSSIGGVIIGRTRDTSFVKIVNTQIGTYFKASINLTCRTIGEEGAFQCRGLVSILDTNTANFGKMSDFDLVRYSENEEPQIINTDVILDTTVESNISCLFTWGAASSGNILTITNASIIIV